MKMTIREAIQYIKQAEGMKYTMELENKIESFLKKLPRNPYDDRTGKITVCDYNEGWFATIWYGEANGYMAIEVDGDNLDPSEVRVKDNNEALKLIKELKGIKTAYDIDQYWNMSDDHRYWRRMNDHDNKARSQRERILEKLR